MSHSDVRPPDTGRPGDELVREFGALAALTYAGSSTDDVYRAVVVAATRLVPGVDHASLMMLSGDTFATVAATDAVARAIDQAEIRLREGPCVDAILDEGMYLDPDLAVGSAWPRLSRFVLDRTPVRGGCGVRIVVDQQKIGALNLWSDLPGRLDAVSADRAMVLAPFASLAVAAGHHREQAATLREGLHSNREIGKAVGLLMAFHKVDETKAWEILRETSRDLNQKVSAVARTIVDYHNSPW
ncbi:GAF and ANTAR domain-containing protein [Nocardioides sp. LHD-245]|uniref:GAF and ANTAR domain-containing protein n=1 Tax=Nocardioides sp. LHD-245 TaxID=3051387 RepID=UPI0027E06103|nr:GAF and ANTAR domain-containing protein [Nocardioides sp. LHD-245]